MPAFIELINSRLCCAHEFFVYSNEEYSGDAENVTSPFYSGFSLSKFYTMVRSMNRADIIIIHGLFDVKVMFTLVFMPWLIRKSKWIVWGGDLYVWTGRYTFRDKLSSALKKIIVPNLNSMITYVNGDYAYAVSQYSSKAKFEECIVYPSNFFRYGFVDKAVNESNINQVLLGNSADPQNNHLEALEKLKSIDDGIMELTIPLSYGCKKNAVIVAQKASEMFGDRVRIISDFMTLEEYSSLLASIDFAVFCHDRQQAMGNIITLLGMGKTVVLKSGLSHSNFLTSKGLVYKDIASLSLDSISREEGIRNSEIVSAYFNESNCVMQLNRIFGDN